MNETKATHELFILFPCLVGFPLNSLLRFLSVQCLKMMEKQKMIILNKTKVLKSDKFVKIVEKCEKAINSTYKNA